MRFVIAKRETVTDSAGPGYEYRDVCRVKSGVTR